METHSRAVRVITLASVVVASASFMLGWGLVAARSLGWRGMGLIAPVAAFTLATPMIVQTVFLLVQGLPAGRRPVPIRLTRSPDGWLLALVLGIALPHDHLAALALTPWAELGRGVPLSIITATAMIAIRVAQLHFARAFRSKMDSQP
jgi:hypothetical protein